MADGRPLPRRVARAALGRVRSAARPFVRAARAFRAAPVSAARTAGHAGGPDLFARRRDPDGPVLVPMPPIIVSPAPAGRVTLLMPGLQMARMTGGPNTALNLVARLADHGIRLRILASLAPLDEDHEAVRSHIRRLSGIADEAAIELASVSPTEPFEVAADEVLIATSWQTAHIAEAARRRTDAAAFIYLIQDFEPGFFAFSTPYALALATYAMPIRVVFNESLLHEHFAAQRVGGFGAGGDRASAPPPWTSFEPAVDRTLFRPGPARAPDARRRLLFYGRPKNERNLFDLGLRAIREAVARGALPADRWDIVSIGSEVPELDLGHGRVLRPGPWLAYPDYAAFVSASDVLVSLMLSPHTSYPPLEAAAAGARVVTNTFSVKTAAALRAISPMIEAVEPDLESLTAAIVAATAGPAARERPDGDTGPAPSSGAERHGAGTGEVRLPGSWDAAFTDTIPWLLATIADLRAGR